MRGYILKKNNYTYDIYLRKINTSEREEGYSSRIIAVMLPEDLKSKSASLYEYRDTSYQVEDSNERGSYMRKPQLLRIHSPAPPPK